MCDRCAFDRSISWELCDGYGLYLTRVCGDCEAEALSKFRPDIMEQYETDEQIEED